VTRWSRHRRWRVPDVAGWLLTFLTVNVGFVFFRADSMRQACEMLTGMAGARGFALSHRYVACLHRLLGPLPVRADPWHVVGEGYAIAVLPLLLLFVFLRHNSAAESDAFRPTRLRVAALALLLFLGLLNLHSYASFVYVNF
jgi:hypothetical protein